MEDCKKFVNYLSNIIGLKAELLEKDLLLHLILLKLKEQKFLNDYLFKGGSCLIKCYLGYYRFSVDIDFTYKHQEYFSNKSQKYIRKFLSNENSRIIETFEKITKEIGMDFKPDKSQRKYMEFGGGDKIITLKLWYDSVSGVEEFFKIQINFVEKILFESKKQKIKSLCPKNKRLSILFSSLYELYSRNMVIECYDVREILCEKVRAILTRRGMKERDFIDVYFIVKHFNISLEKQKKHIAEKINFILNLYEKYRKNFAEQAKNIEYMKIRKEEHLLIEQVDENFYKFLESFKKFLFEIKGMVEGEKK